MPRREEQEQKGERGDRDHPDPLNSQPTPGPLARTPGPRPVRAARTGPRSRSGPASAPPPGTASRSGSPGRRDARTKPVTGTATFTTCAEMLETVQPVRLAGTRCRFRYASVTPPPISATEPAAVHPATHWAVRALTWIPSRRLEPSAWALSRRHSQIARYTRTVPGALRRRSSQRSSNISSSSQGLASSGPCAKSIRAPRHTSRLRRVCSATSRSAVNRSGARTSLPATTPSPTALERWGPRR